VITPVADLGEEPGEPGPPIILCKTKKRRRAASNPPPPAPLAQGLDPSLYSFPIHNIEKGVGGGGREKGNQ